MEEEMVSSVLSTEELMRLSNPFARLMNDMQNFDGEKVYDVISAGLYTLGCALAQSGCFIDVEATIKDAVAPLAAGYTDAREKIRKSWI